MVMYTNAFILKKNVGEVTDCVHKHMLQHTIIPSITSF